MSVVLEQAPESQLALTQVLFGFATFLAAAIWIYDWRLKQTKLYKLGNKIPGPDTIPILGNALIALGKSPSEVMALAMELSNKYTGIARAWLGPKLYIILTEPDDVEIILNSNVHIDKSADYKYFQPWLGEGLLISTGEKWRTHRKMIAPTFHINILKSFVGAFNDNSKSVVQRLKPLMGKVFDVHDYMSEVTVDILLETQMGVNIKSQDKSGYEYAMAVMKMCDIIHKRQYKFWLHFDIFFKFTKFFKKQIDYLNTIHGLTSKVIKEKKKIYIENKNKGIIPPTLKEITESPVDGGNTKTLSDNVFEGLRDDLDFNDENDVGQKKRLAFLDLMIESAQNGSNIITDTEIKEQVDTIMFEGHDTTAAGSSFTLCLLGVYHEIQDKVYDELYEIFGDSDRPATFEDTVNMKYLERVILESLRLYPPVPLIARTLKQDVQIVSENYVLPAGATIGIGTFKIHRNPNYYKNPDEFNPDNFLPENTQNRHYYSFIPFSAGPRSCVGRKYAMLKLKVLLSTFLRNYRVISAVPEKEFTLQADIILKRTDGFRIKVEPRNRVPSTASQIKTNV